MRAVFGVVSLLIALAAVAVIAVKQFEGVGQAEEPSESAAARASAASPHRLSDNGTVRERARSLESHVADDVAKAASRAASRGDEADK